MLSEMQHSQCDSSNQNEQQVLAEKTDVRRKKYSISVLTLEQTVPNATLADYRKLKQL
jgi:hypothetical protein